MENLIYLDNAATTFPKPPEVYDFMFEFFRTHGVNPGRSGYDATIETEEVVYGTRKMLTDFFNGTDPNQLTFSYNASDSLNMIIQGLVVKGDHVITTKLEHNSVLRPVYHLEHDHVSEMTLIPFDRDGYLDPGDIKKAIKKNTKLVIINHCSNVIGTVQPIAEIGKICKDAGVIFAVDASQTAGVIPIDVQAMHIDALAFTGHKCLMGPTGIGGSYCTKELPIKSTKFGGTGVRSAQKLHLEEFPYRLECGTLNIIGVAGLHAGQRWIMKNGIQSIHQNEMKLWRQLRDGLKAIPGVTLYCAESVKAHNAVLSFNVNGFEAADVGTILDVDYNIACRTGLHCAPLVHEQLGTDKIHGMVRFSLGPFNTEKHIGSAIQAIKEIAAIKN
ncbi:MAG: aminotransferase class V-fold PLP-dependent enzyme [Bacteroidota bacterium]